MEMTVRKEVKLDAVIAVGHASLSQSLKDISYLREMSMY